MNSLKFNKTPYSINTINGRTMTVGMVLEGSGLAYRQIKRGTYTLDHVKSGMFVGQDLKITEVSVKKLVRALANEIDFNRTSKELKEEPNIKEKILKIICDY